MKIAVSCYIFLNRIDRNFENRIFLAITVMQFYVKLMNERGLGFEGVDDESSHSWILQSAVALSASALGGNPHKYRMLERSPHLLNTIVISHSLLHLLRRKKNKKKRQFSWKKVRNFSSDNLVHFSNYSLINVLVKLSGWFLLVVAVDNSRAMISKHFSGLIEFQISG